MNSDAPRPEKVTDESDIGSPRSFYQYLLQRCGSQHGTSAAAGKEGMAASDPKQR